MQALIEQRTKKVKLLAITPELVLDLLKIPEGGVSFSGTTVWCVDDPIPVSARALRAGINERGDIVLLVEDESFREVAEGNYIPDLRPKYSWEHKSEIERKTLENLGRMTEQLERGA